MITSIHKYFPSDFICKVPEGGMFCWVYTNRKLKFASKDVLLQSIKRNVGFVPGTPFFARKTGVPFSMRLNFTNQSEENIEKGIKTIGSILQTIK